MSPIAAKRRRVNDLLGGQIPFMFSNLSVVKGNIEGGKLRALAVTTHQARAVAAERADARRDLPRLRCRHLVRAGRAHRHAARGDRADQRRGEEDRRARRTSSSASIRLGMIPDQDRTPGRDQRVHQGRDRQMGEGDQGRRCETGGLTPGPLKSKLRILARRGPAGHRIPDDRSRSCSGEISFHFRPKSRLRRSRPAAGLTRPPAAPDLTI